MRALFDGDSKRPRPVLDRRGCSCYCLLYQLCGSEREGYLTLPLSRRFRGVGSKAWGGLSMEVA